MELTELQNIYNEMDAESRKEMVTAAAKLLEVQKTLESTPAKNVLQKTVFNRNLQKLHTKHILGYLAIGILLIISTYIFWVALINPALLMTGINPLEMVRIILTALAGLFLVGSGLVDFILRRIKTPWRLLIITAGFACTEPSALTDLIGISLIVLIISVEVIQWKREKTAIFT
jgi:hypothetical protein